MKTETEKNRMLIQLQDDWGAYIGTVASRRAIEGDDYDEIVADGYNLLWQIAEGLNWDVDCPQFIGTFKTSFTNLVTDRFRRMTRGKRDINKTTRLETHFYSDDSGSDDTSKLNPGVIGKWSDGSDNNVREFEIADLVADFMGELDEHDKQLFEVLYINTEPIDLLWDELKEQYDYARTPTKIPDYVYGQYLGWTDRKVRHHRYNIQMKFTEYTGKKAYCRYFINEFSNSCSLKAGSFDSKKFGLRSLTGEFFSSTWKDGQTYNYRVLGINDSITHPLAVLCTDDGQQYGMVVEVLKRCRPDLKI